MVGHGKWVHVMFLKTHISIVCFSKHIFLIVFLKSHILALVDLV
jgi:hypothetical protein